MNIINLYNEFKLDLFRYVKFIFGGGLSLVLNLIITYILTEFFLMWHMISFAIALGAELLFLLTYHTFITFKKKGRIIHFIIIISLISGINWILVYIMTVLFNFNYLISIVLVAGFVSIVNYVLNRNVVFKGT